MGRDINPGGGSECSRTDGNPRPCRVSETARAPVHDPSISSGSSSESRLLAPRGLACAFTGWIASLRLDGCGAPPPKVWPWGSLSGATGASNARASSDLSGSNISIGGRKYVKDLGGSPSDVVASRILCW
ncbi:lignin medium expressed protein 12 [Heterobasidion irregulare TC 32-1]|uniref:Lignin medium expressed protein 12 n=1 Tax=Heterobasidion irregulare (strain TC 32-1) TaxID=747525 RepID=W4KCP9_HETIT|nr:lignin medium expressed protein 12 [Heterobasidion irregulare TC 32-1]ETW83115.1 lignin medium expressed protein 12 [Heterobasidion irregulare TC 32-1]